MSGASPPATRPAPGDRIRGAALVAGLAAIGWFLLTRYSGPGRLGPHRQMVLEFFQAAEARDSARLRSLVSGDQPVRWALAAGREARWLLPHPDSAVDIQGANRSGGREEVAVWVKGICAQQPYFVAFTGEGRDRRIEAIRTACSGPGRPDGPR